MSKLFRALERAEREGTLRQQPWSWQQPQTEEAPQTKVSDAPPEEAPGAAPPIPEPVAPAPKPKTDAKIDPRLVTLLTPEAFETEPYRILGHMLERAHRDSGLSVVAIVSPGAAEGKTTTAINLAGALSQHTESRVLLLEAELRRPTIGTYLRLPHIRGKGLVEAVLNPALSLEDVVRPCPPFNLDVLLAGRTLTSPYDLLRSPRLEKLLFDARQRYDWIIVDAPPMLPFADCRIIEQWVDAFLVIVAAHKTPKKLLEEALAALEPAKIAGLLFNKDEQLVPGYYSQRYYMSPPNGHRQGWRFTRRHKKE